MTSTGAGIRSDVTLKISQLQNLCKRDPDGYREDYDAQVRRLESECGILALSPSSKPSNSLVELIQFSAAVSASSYKGKESDKIANMLINLLLGNKTNNADNNTTTISQKEEKDPNTTDRGSPLILLSSSALSLHRDVRKACVSALILMRNKGAIQPLKLLELFFRIMSVVPDKSLRELLYHHIVNDIRNINKKGKRDEKVNRSIQAFLHRVVSMSQGGAEEQTAVAQKRAIDMTCELYRRGVWTDDRTVAIVSSAVTSTTNNVMCRAIRFFLNIEEKMAEDKQREEDDEWDGVNTIDFHKHSRKTKTRKRHVARQVKNRIKAQKAKEQPDWLEMEENNDAEGIKKLYPAIELLRDPQGIVEKLLKRMKGSNSTLKHEVKLLMMNFVTRIVGNHELLLLSLYPFLQRYMASHQRDVTSILAYSVQACHEYVPPEEVYAILKTIAHNFITERCSGEEMAVGINAVRAICARVPSVLSTEGGGDGTTNSVSMDIEGFVRDLAAFGKHRDRSVSIAGRSWTNFIREIHPGLLQGKDRGLKGTALHKSGTKPLPYGQRMAASGVEGADLLAAYEAQKKAAALIKKNEGDEYDTDDESVGLGEESMNDVDQKEKSPVDDDDKTTTTNEDSDMDDVESDKAPKLVLMDTDGKPIVEKDTLDITTLNPEERDKLKQEVSSNRIFSSAEFAKMRKLVEREKRFKRDPREAARRKRAIARGEDYDVDISSDSDSEDEAIHIAGAVNPTEIMADSKRKRQSKAERLQSILTGREKFEFKTHGGGSTNTEKKRGKNFLMTKYSLAARIKRGRKETLKKANLREAMSHDKKKRRRRI
eukprot:CAMPEP_0194136088 /NCGR_PEP_ID=MMETSP0152-20130528/6120_1 /TAXON_ID=1049557 /ORGANISM="Thalassiothrix antarctica, Strain L6-D1" /LENGTH=824 /DNA_ID=CAMNT_0038832595 /DNA_START=77 /DNA_END=2551 /DNA_ORIENTATION=+